MTRRTLSHPRDYPPNTPRTDWNRSIEFSAQSPAPPGHATYPINLIHCHEPPRAASQAPLREPNPDNSYAREGLSTKHSRTHRRLSVSCEPGLRPHPTMQPRPSTPPTTTHPTHHHNQRCDDQNHPCQQGRGTVASNIVFTIHITNTNRDNSPQAPP